MPLGANGVPPTSRKGREKWGTLSSGGVGEIKKCEAACGVPPTLAQRARKD